MVLFLGVKRDLDKQAHTIRAQEHLLEQLKTSEASGPAPAPPEAAPAASGPRSGINLNKRVQALRLHRRGEDIGHIAAALGVPRREIELLLRIEQLSANRAAAARAAGLP
jgi:hypothetical protein